MVLLAYCIDKQNRFFRYKIRFLVPKPLRGQKYGTQTHKKAQDERNKLKRWRPYRPFGSQKKHMKKMSDPLMSYKF